MYKPLTGNGTVTFGWQLAEHQRFAKVGIMMREDVTAGAETFTCT